LLVKIDEEYEAKPPYRLLKKLGYEMNLAFDPVEVYRVQNRMCEAEKALRKEVIGRQQSMGPQSKGYISQLSTLALLLSVAGNLEEAEQAACSAADSSREAYGDESDETISALNYLAKILYKREKWVALETLQHKLIPIKLSREDIGPTDTTTLNSQNYLVVAYCFQGQYDKSIELAQKLIAFRKEHLGEEHTETLVTTNWLCRALLEKGEFEGLETRVRKLVGASERVCGKTDDATVERKELLASILLSQADPNRVQFNSKGLEEARQLVCEVLDEIDKQNGNQNLVLFLRAQTTLICILAIESRFEDANHEIENAAPNLECFKDAVGEHNVELQSFKRVVDYVRALQELQHDAREESVSEADAIRGKLARRW
jgi:tetratricopeptide (TPR) repeat protein